MKEAEGLVRVGEAVPSIITGPEAAAAAWVSSAIFSGSVEEIDDGSKSKTWAGSTVGCVCTTADVIGSVAPSARVRAVVSVDDPGEAAMDKAEGAVTARASDALMARAGGAATVGDRDDTVARGTLVGDAGKVGGGGSGVEG